MNTSISPTTSPAVLKVYVNGDLAAADTVRTAVTPALQAAGWRARQDNILNFGGGLHLLNIWVTAPTDAITNFHRQDHPTITAVREALAAAHHEHGITIHALDLQHQRRIPPTPASPATSP